MDAKVEEVLRCPLYYLDWEPNARSETPYYVASRPPAGQPQTNEVFISVDTLITNARARKDTFSLAGNSFEWAHNEYGGSIQSEEEVSAYITAMEEFLKHYLGASRVYAYDHVIRQQRDHGVPQVPGDSEMVKRTIKTTHLDITPECAQKRVQAHCGFTDNGDPAHTHWQIINLWRPLVDVVQSQPIAVCDSGTLCPTDLIECEMIYPHVTTEIFHVKPNTNQRWYYLRHQKRSEVLLMKNYDSNGSLGCAHTAFDDPTVDKDAERRRSIELRCFVFY